MKRSLGMAGWSYPRRADDPYPTSISLDCMHRPDSREIVGRARMRWARRQRRRRRRRRRSTARRMWAEGKRLGEIAQALGCSAYDLSPWLYAHEIKRGES